MGIKKTTLNVDNITTEWFELLMYRLPKNDFVVLYEDKDLMVWFLTKFRQYLSVQGGNETAVLFGNFITDRQSFIHQLNFSLPSGFVLGDNSHALFDLLLNFETEPKIRAIFWTDTRNLFEQDQKVFDEILGLMVLASYGNRNGIATRKEDFSEYKVDQRNFFFFSKGEFDTNISSRFDHEYPIGTVFSNGNVDGTLDFNLIMLTDI